MKMVLPQAERNVTVPTFERYNASFSHVSHALGYPFAHALHVRPLSYSANVSCLNGKSAATCIGARTDVGGSRSLGSLDEKGWLHWCGCAFDLQQRAESRSVPGMEETHYGADAEPTNASETRNAVKEPAREADRPPTEDEDEEHEVRSKKWSHLGPFELLSS
jgi:hypothetical protein